MHKLVKWLMDQREWIVDLKDGTSIDARQALAEMALLQQTLKKDPVLIDLLYAVAKGEEHEVPADRLEGFFPVNGEIRGATKLVLVNSVKQTPEGLSLDDPFMNTPENRHVLETVKQNRGYFLQHLFPDDRGSSGRSI